MINPLMPPMPMPGGGGPMMNGVPVGTVVAFAGKIVSSAVSPPTEYMSNVESQGWMVCDGRSLTISDYLELYAVLGDLYGAENGKFNIPDYRGYFLRGVDLGAGNDPDSGDRTAPDGSTVKDLGIGSKQNDALQTHQHTYAKTEKGEVSTGKEGKQPIATIPVSQLTENPIDEPQNPKISQHETRPKNISVHYLIKYCV